MPINQSEWEAQLTAAGTAYNFVDVPEYGQVKFYELANKGPQLSYQSRVHRCERTFRVWPYDKSWAFCAWMLGWSKLGPSPGSSDCGVYRVTPQPMPIFNRPNGKPFAYATDVVRHEGGRPDGIKFSPFDGTTVVGNFWWADVTIAYGSVPYKMLADADMTKNPYSLDPDEASLARFVSRSTAPSGKHIQFPAGSLRWEGVASSSPGSAGQDEISTQTMGKVLPFIDLVYTWHEVPAIPYAVYSHIGTVNYTPFDGRAAERLLLVGVDITPRRMVTGDRAFDIAYRMKYGDIDGTKNHNYFFRIYKPTGTTYTDVRWTLNKPYYKDSGSTKHYVFEKQEFRDLFRGPFETNWSGQN